MALAFEYKVPLIYRKPFIAKVKDISGKLDFDPDWVMGIINFESAGTFSAKVPNNIGCYGLIQFCPDSKGGSTKRIGGKTYTMSQIKSMSEIEQLDLVYEYFKPYKGKINSYLDTYFAVFFPLAIGKPDDWIIQGGGLTAQQIYNSNPAFRSVKDGKLRVWEVKKKMLSVLPKEWINEGSVPLFVKSYKTQIIIGAGLITLGAATAFYFNHKNN